MFRELVIAKDRQRLEGERVITHAYLTARYGRLQKLPALKAELDKYRLAVGESGEQTVEQQRSALAVLSEQYGIPLRRGKPDDEVWVL